MLRRALVTLVAAAALAITAGEARAASMFDPDVRWKTIVTPHFRVNFPEGYEAIAKTAAGYAEEAHQLLSPYLDEVPAMRTELNLMDNEDTVNGFGFPLPNNQIFIYLTSPPEDQLHGRYDAWLRDLLIHEYTHVLHLEKTAGLPAWINGFFGRSYFPNMFQPIFLIEGLAVTTETRFSSGGRGRESAYRMYLREAALADALVSIDKASGYHTVDHPGGEIPYVYGTAFYRYVCETYGEHVPAAIAKRYAHYPFFGVYGVDEVLKAETGKDAQALWAEMQTWLKVRAAVEEQAILERGPLTATTPVTSGGMHHRRPTYKPDGTLTWAEWTGHGYSTLKERRADGTIAGIISKGPFGLYSFSPDGKWLYHTRTWDENRFTRYDDLFRWNMEKKTIERLSNRARLDQASVSPDGRWVVAVENGQGQSNLVKLRADGTGRQALTTRADRTQFGAPVWHPKRHLLAVSAWKDGSRDLYLVDPETGAMEPLWRDRDVEINPTWSPDGRHLIFASDQTGVYNLYAYELATGQLFRMTNVMTGLLEPAVSPDGKTVAATRYGLKGFDVVTLDWNPQAWVPVPVPESDRAIAQPEPAVTADWPVVDYDPLPSLRPKLWAPFAFMDDRGPVLGFTTIGQDSLFQHYLFGAFGYGVASNRPFYSIGYSNDVLYPSLYAYAMDTTLISRPYHEGVLYQVPQRGQYQGLSVTFPGLPSAFLQNNWVTGDTFTLGLSAGHVANAFTVDPALPADKLPPVGQTNTLSLTYRYGDNYKFAYSISPEGGDLATLGFETAQPLLGSQHQYDRFWADWRRYIPLPWKHHVLAVRASGGASVGERGGDFYMGGFDSATLLQNVDLRTASSVGTRQLPLRGYSFGADSGSKGLALATEYRFPLMSVQRGWGIYPVYVRNLHGALFADAGQAWADRFELGNTLVGVGAELRAQTYFIQAPTEVRFGIGQGLTQRESLAPWPSVFVDIGSYF